LRSVTELVERSLDRFVCGTVLTDGSDGEVACDVAISPLKAFDDDEIKVFAVSVITRRLRGEATHLNLVARIRRTPRSRGIPGMQLEVLEIVRRTVMRTSTEDHLGGEEEEAEEAEEVRVEKTMFCFLF